MSRSSWFMPQCRWVILDASKGNAPVGAANDRDGIVKLMHQVPETERDHHWILDRLAQDRAPFDHAHNRKSTYGWDD